MDYRFTNWGASRYSAKGQSSHTPFYAPTDSIVRRQVYDPTETRVLISHASPGREGLISQLSLVLKADLTISAGLHFRYGASYNEFSVQSDSDPFKQKLESSAKSFNEVWDSVKSQVETVIESVARSAISRIEVDPVCSANQRGLLTNALAVANRVPTAVGGTQASEEAAWKNTWNWYATILSTVILYAR